MSFADARTGFETRFQTQLGVSQPTVTIEFENAPFREPERAPYVRFSIAEPVGDQVTVGATVDSIRRHRGQVVVDVFVPERTDSVVADGIADDVAAIFVGARFEEGSSGWIICQIPRLIPIGVNDGGFYHKQVLTEYSRCITG